MSGAITKKKEDLKSILQENDLWNYDAYIAFCNAKEEQQEKDKKTETVFSAYKAAIQADKLMSWTYLICNFLTLVFAISALFLPGIAWLPLLVFGIGTLWNYIDAVGGLVIAFYQHKTDNQFAMGTNILASLQLTAGTTLLLAALLGVASGSLLTIGALAASFGFAACMGISCLLEYRAVQTGKARLKTEENLLNSPLQDIDQADFKLYYEKDKQSVENHKGAVKAWLFCFIAMMAIASIGFAPLSPTLLAIFMIGIAAICTVSGIYRLWPNSSRPTLSVTPESTPRSSISLSAHQFDHTKTNPPQPQVLVSQTPDKRLTTPHN